MKEEIKKIAASLSNAWSELTDLPFPGNFHFGISGKHYSAMAFPLLGWLLGAAAALVFGIISAVFNTAGGSILFAVAAWLFFTFKDSGRGDVLFFRRMSGIFKLPEQPWSSVFPAMISVLRLLLLLILAFGGGIAQLPMIIGGAFWIQAMLAVHTEGVPELLPYNDSGRRIFTAVSAVLALISFCLQPLATAFSLAVLAVFFHIGGGKLRNSPDYAATISAAGYWAEWALLAAGVLAI